VRQGEIAASKALRNDAAQLRETTMEPRTRSLLRVVFTETDSRPPAEIKETKRWVKN
jgi:DNA gyrase/topoisomerase IV subunit B